MNAPPSATENNLKSYLYGVEMYPGKIKNFHILVELIKSINKQFYQMDFFQSSFKK